MQLLEREDLQLIAEIGLMAALEGDVENAEAIFKAIAVVRPALSISYIGHAIAYLQARRVDDALRMLDQGLARVPSDDQADLHAFRGMALQLAGRGSESLRALRQAGPLPLARRLLGETVAA